MATHMQILTQDMGDEQRLSDLAKNDAAEAAAIQADLSRPTPLEREQREVTRGFAAIGLDRCKNHLNLGSVLRAAHCYDASLVVVGGGRIKKSSTDTTKAWRHIPCIEADSVMDAIPHGAMPVVVELSDRARTLTTFTHPQSAFYIFGPEDGSVSKSILERAQLVVQIPTRYCMNLAATVNVVLYDRFLKART